MQSLPRPAIRQLLYRRSISAVLLLVYGITAGGVPIPFGNSRSKTGELFPCSNDGCGCATAEQCWRSCCCHSLAERFVWAREHKVRPPEFAIAEARRSGFDLAWLRDTTAPGSAPGLNSGQLANCAASENPEAKPRAAGLLAMPRLRCCCAKHHEPQPNGQTSGRVIGWKALQCQGHSANWFAAVPTLFAAACGQSDEPPFIEWLGPALSDSSGRIAGELLLPPPERT
jgi:hypothetical protein